MVGMKSLLGFTTLPSITLCYQSIELTLSGNFVLWVFMFSLETLSKHHALSWHEIEKKEAIILGFTMFLLPEQFSKKMQP